VPDLTPWTQPRGRNMLPGDRGFKGWAFDPVFAWGSGLMTNGAVFGSRVWHSGGPIRFVHFLALNPQSGATAGQNFAGIYHPTTGALLAQTADMAAYWATLAAGTLAACPLATPYVAPAGWFDVALLANAATLNPQVYRIGSNVVGVQSAGTNGLNVARSFSGPTGQTSLPAILTPRTERSLGEWVAIS
jgi:hypothetical protein